jgi:hypothetical protein
LEFLQAAICCCFYADMFACLYMILYVKILIYYTLFGSNWSVA